MIQFITDSSVKCASTSRSGDLSSDDFDALYIAICTNYITSHNVIIIHVTLRCLFLSNLLFKLA